MKECDCLNKELKKVQVCNEFQKTNVMTQIEELIERLKNKQIIR
jgi:hypothetical protein